MEQARYIDFSASFPPGRVALLKGAEAISIAVGAFSDGRGSDPCFIMERKGPAAGPGNGSYETSRPVAELLRDMVSDALKQAGFAGSQKIPKATLTACLDELSFGVLVGFARCQLKSTAEATFRLTEEGTGKVLWKAGLSASGAAAAGDLISIALSATLTELASALASDPGFTAAALATGA